MVKPFSFILITYNRPADMLELLGNILQLQEADRLVEEVIVLNNASTEDYTAVKQFISIHPEAKIHYIESPDNLGVAKGRNRAVQLAVAPILIMLDDDSVLQNRDALVNLLAEFERANTSRPKAIVSFRVLYYDTLEMQVNGLPHKRFKEYSRKSFFETYYYAGGAHAILKEVVESLGYYPEDFFYGMEEYDLAYRVVDAGYSIVYSAQITMLHKESPLGRKPKEEKLRMMWVNKSKVAFRYLPRRFFWTTATMWSFEYLRAGSLNLAGWLKGWKSVFQIPSLEKRSPVKKSTLRYLKSLKARLWY